VPPCPKEARLYHAPRYPVFTKGNGGLKLLFQNRRLGLRYFVWRVMNQPPKQRFFLFPLGGKNNV
jgi:hypothetical protein